MSILHGKATSRVATASITYHEGGPDSGFYPCHRSCILHLGKMALDSVDVKDPDGTLNFGTAARR